MKSVALLLSIIALPAFSQRPILTEGAPTLGHHRVRVAVGVEHYEKSRTSVHDAPLTMTRAFVLSVHHGVAENVNFDLDWRGGLFATMQNGERVSDWGDLWITTKINFVREGTAWPSVSTRNTVKLPNTRYLPHKLGSNETDYFGQLLLTKHTGSVEWRLNIGLGIIGDPESKNVQDDIYSAGIAALVPVSGATTFFVESVGFTGYFDGDDKLALRAGGSTLLGGLEVHWFGSARIGGQRRDTGAAFELSEDWGVGVVFRATFHLGL
jgi:hypothetical protein